MFKYLTAFSILLSVCGMPTCAADEPCDTMKPLWQEDAHFQYYRCMMLECSLWNCKLVLDDLENAKIDKDFAIMNMRSAIDTMELLIIGK